MKRKGNDLTWEKQAEFWKARQGILFFTKFSKI